MIIATLMKLFAIKIVANNFFGEAKSLFTRWWAFVPEDESVSFSAGLSEKKATSEPEIKPENKRSINKTPKEISISRENGLKKSANKINVG